MRSDGKTLDRLDSTLIDTLRNPEAYSHPVESIEVLETHISWIILTGAFAYKIKKPVRLEFLDFSELGNRRFYCQEEVRLNRRWAPDIYIDVVPISVHAGQLVVGGEGEAVEYAVRMHQFEQGNRLDAQLVVNRLSEKDMDELASVIALRHGAANIVETPEHAKTLSLIKVAMWDNLDALEGQLPEKKLDKLRQWTTAQLDRLDPVLQQRLSDGFVRECHGDLHLSNLVRLPSGIAAFDCIEFSADLRNTDVMADIAFLVMDLVSRQRFDLAYRFLNRYLEISGDYGSMQVFTLYFVYRCLVRAKVAAIRSRELIGDEFATRHRFRLRKFCDMALKKTLDRVPALVVMHGLSGSGKTWLSSRLMSVLPAVRIRSDIERKRLFRLDETANSGSGVAQGIYTEAANSALYGQLHEMAAKSLRAGHDVIVDAAYLKSHDREHAREIATDCHAEFILIHADAPISNLRSRIRERTFSDADASEANLKVLEHQLAIVDPLTPAELQVAVLWDSRENIAADVLGRELRHRASRPDQPEPAQG